MLLFILQRSLCPIRFGEKVQKYAQKNYFPTVFDLYHFLNYSMSNPHDVKKKWCKNDLYAWSFFISSLEGIQGIIQSSITVLDIRKLKFGETNFFPIKHI